MEKDSSLPSDQTEKLNEVQENGDSTKEKDSVEPIDPPENGSIAEKIEESQNESEEEKGSKDGNHSSQEATSI